jgi:hypothetical protein
VLIGLSIGLGTPTIGQPVPQDIEFALDYRAGAGCPDRSHFESAVLSRVPAARVVEPERAEVRFRIELSGVGEDAASSILIELADGTYSQRTIRDVSCVDAAASMAVMAALVLDGQALPVDGTEARAPETTSAQPSPALPPTRERRSTKPVSPSPPQTAQPSVPIGTRDAGLGNARSSLQPIVGAAVAGAWETGVAPDAPLAVLAGLELRWELDQPLSPSVRLSLVYTDVASVTLDDGEARFQLIAARLSACPLRIGSGRPLGLFTCADFDAGRLEGKGTRVTNERTQAMPWLGAGPGLRAEYALGRQLAVEVLAGARYLIREDRFVFQPGVEIHDVPRVSAGIAVGVSGRLR